MNGLTAFCFLVSGCVLLSGTTAFAQKSKKPPRVAIFSPLDFPYYNITPQLNPARIAEDLRAVGLQADLLDATALTDTNRFTVDRYTAVVLPYGNTYPHEALASLRRFHQSGGSLIP